MNQRRDRSKVGLATVKIGDLGLSLTERTKQLGKKVGNLYAYKHWLDRKVTAAKAAPAGS
ncbi:MAG: hypothetical protein BWY92_00077 [Firmicutes bacterium ADurb.BinA052]|nr:MAG: hypothetical protein BWY92_00077 [Firmicutes bacterium ADurb.BinA052]